MLRRGWWSALVLGQLGWACSALGLEPASGPVILTLTGPALIETNGPGMAEFDREMLMALPQGSISSSTPWFDGVQTFDGPDFVDLLGRLAPGAQTVTVTALNDYSATIPVPFIAQHGAILAMRRNGEVMRVRDHGPIFVIFPYDKDVALRNETVFGWSVWQVHTIRAE